MEYPMKRVTLTPAEKECDRREYFCEDKVIGDVYRANKAKIIATVARAFAITDNAAMERINNATIDTPIYVGDENIWSEVK